LPRVSAKQGFRSDVACLGGLNEMAAPRLTSEMGSKAGLTDRKSDFRFAPEADSERTSHHVGFVPASDIAPVQGARRLSAFLPMM
jgi:hypothetical protein